MKGCQQLVSYTRCTSKVLINAPCTSLAFLTEGAAPVPDSCAAAGASKSSSVTVIVLSNVRVNHLIAGGIGGCSGS